MKQNKGFILVPALVLVAAVIAVSTFVTYRQTRNFLSSSPTPLSTPRSSASAFAPLPQSTPPPKIVPSATPSPKPLTLDISVDPNGTINRKINDGSGKGLVDQGTVTLSESPTYTPVIDLWKDIITACIQTKSNETISGTNLSYSVTDNGKQISNQKYDAASITPAGIQVCIPLSRSGGDHEITFTANSDKQVREVSFSNNTVSFKYTMKGDSQAPTYYIVGPNKETEGTCIFPQSMHDNLSLYSEIKVEQFIDNQLKTPDEYGRICLQGPAGESHTYNVRATDKAGNTNEQSKQFTLQ